MNFHRLRRLAMACRRSLYPTTIFVIATLGGSPLAAAAEVAGQVVDANDRPVPRALVQVLDNSGNSTSWAFTDESGRFALDAGANCRIKATLSGFRTATLPCSSEPLRVVLEISPIREDIVVSATRTEAPLAQVGASATVFTADDLERRQEPLLADLLVGTPGAVVLRSGGPGTVTSLFMRGGESDYNKVLLDGVPLNEPGGSFFLNNLSTENLERVEILRGAYSALFGSDAMASVIQLFTKRANGVAQRPQGSAQLDAGSYGTLHASAGVHGATQRIDYSIGAARLDSDNRVPNSALENTTLSGSLGLLLGGNATLRFVGRGEIEHVGTPGTTAYGRPDLDAFFERNDGIGSVSFDQQATAMFRQRATYSYAASNQQSTNTIADPPYVARFEGRTGTFQSFDFLGDSLNEYRRHHASYQGDLHLRAGGPSGDHTLTMLADWDGERYTATNRRAVPSAITENGRDNFGVAAQHQMLWRRLFVTAGARLERNETFGTAVTPRASVVYVLHDPAGGFGETRVKASAGTGIKEPTMAESFSQSSFSRGNLDLKPERSRSAEIGLEQRLANDRAKVELTYFDARFEDVIQLLTTNPATYEGQYFNTGATRARGFELGFEAAPSAMLRVRAGYTLLDGEVVETAAPDDIVFGLGNELFRRPRHSGSIGATATWQRVVADLNGAFIGSFVDSDFGLFDIPLAKNPGHDIWDARITVKFTSRLSGLLLIDNLTNQDYSEPFGYQPLKRTVRAGVRVAF